MPAQPALERPHGGELGPRVHPSQFDMDATSPPAGMLTAQLEGGFQQRRSSEWAWPTGVVAGLQRGGGTIGTRLQGTSSQAPDRAQWQAELPGDIRGGGPEPDHAIEC